jgi:hypothetical protein
MGGGQAIGRIGMQFGGLLERGCGSAPMLALRMVLSGLPSPEGLQLCA